MDSKKILLNAVCTSAVAMLATKYFIGDDGNVSYYGVSMDGAVAVGLGCGAGSIVSDLTSEMVIKKIGASNQVMNFSTLGVQVGVGGASSALVLYFGGVPVQNLPMAFAVGSLSKLGGGYTYDKILDSRTGILPIF